VLSCELHGYWDHGCVQAVCLLYVLSGFPVWTMEITAVIVLQSLPAYLDKTTTTPAYRQPYRKRFTEMAYDNEYTPVHEM
jgi:hypothetical protein